MPFLLRNSKICCTFAPEMKRILFIAWCLAITHFGIAQSRVAPTIPEDSVRSLCEYMVTVYPKATLQDLYKTCYQDFFGAEHMISDTASARAYLHREYEQSLELSRQVDLSSLPVEELTGFRHRCRRMYLYYDWSLMEIPEEVIFQSFLQAGSIGPVHDDWYGEWCQIEAIALQFHSEWQDEELQNLLHQAAINNQAVHHSAAFRENYHPHYRIIPNK